MNPQTGEVLALVSLPTYDNNDFARGISNADYAKLLKNKDKPLTNHAVQAHYPPGSTYKLVTATGVLAEKEITPSTQVMTRPFLTLGGTRFYEWNRRGWGACNIFCGFGHSSDTFFFQMAGKLGADRLAKYGHEYGFGKPTGIDLPNEVSGIVPSNKWKQDALGAPMFGGEVYQSGIGQGYDVVTPIQLINAYAAMANGGKLLQPQVVREIVGPDGEVVRPFKKKLIHKLDVPKSVLTTMRKAARTVVTIRHTYNLVDMPIRIAGKSGTAEFGVRDSKGRLPYSQWFVGFVPKDPKKGSFSEAHLGAHLPGVRVRLAHRRQRGHRDREVLLHAPLRHQEGLPQPRPPRAGQLLPEQLRCRRRRTPGQGSTDGRDPRGFGTRDGLGEPLGRVRVARVRPPARHVRRTAGRGRPRDGLHEQPRERAPLPPGRDHVLARSDVGGDRDRDVPHRDRVRLQVAQDLRVAAVRLPDRPAAADPRHRRRGQRCRPLGARSANSPSSSASWPRS